MIALKLLQKESVRKAAKRSAGNTDDCGCNSVYLSDARKWLLVNQTCNDDRQAGFTIIHRQLNDFPFLYKMFFCPDLKES